MASVSDTNSQNPKRICSWPGCDTKLSHYNPDDYCSAHESEKPPEYQLTTENPRCHPVISSTYSAERRVRELKIDLVVQVYCGNGPFWQAIRRSRVAWGVEMDVRLPPTRPTFSTLPPPQLSRTVPKGDRRRQKHSLKKLRAWLRERRKEWNTCVRAVWESVIPRNYREAADCDRFTAACMLYDPPDLEIHEFAEYGGLNPEGLPEMVWKKDAGQVSEAWEEFHQGMIEEIGKRLSALDGRDIRQLTSDIYSETDLHERFATRLREAPMIPTRAKKGPEGKPSRGKATAIKYAALYYDHNYKDPQKKGRWHWTHEDLVDELGLDEAEKARRVNKKDPKERERRKAIGKRTAKLGQQLREKHRNRGT